MFLTKIIEYWVTLLLYSCINFRCMCNICCARLTKVFHRINIVYIKIRLGNNSNVGRRWINWNRIQWSLSSRAKNRYQLFNEPFICFHKYVRMDSAHMDMMISMCFVECHAILITSKPTKV